MHICFDNSSLLPRNVYYLEYKGIRFKLIQNNSYKWSDVLLTIVPHNDRISEEQAFLAASEYLSALAWRNESRVTVWTSGGFGVPDNYKLRAARCRVFDLHRTPLAGYYIDGYDIVEIPEIENEKQKSALMLFREANSSNNTYLSFLFYWQIMETGETEAIEWVNKIYKKNLRAVRYSKR